MRQAVDREASVGLPGQAWVIVGCGVASAQHAGKLPAALPVLTQERGVTLVQGGFQLAMIPFAGKTPGAVLGQMAERLGAWRVMRTGLTLLGVGSLIGAMASAPRRPCSGRGRWKGWGS